MYGFNVFKKNGSIVDCTVNHTERASKKLTYFWVIWDYIFFVVSFRETLHIFSFLFGLIHAKIEGKNIEIFWSLSQIPLEHIKREENIWPDLVWYGMHWFFSFFHRRFFLFIQVYTLQIPFKLPLLDHQPRHSFEYEIQILNTHNTNQNEGNWKKMLNESYEFQALTLLWPVEIWYFSYFSFFFYSCRVTVSNVICTRMSMTDDICLIE